MPALKPNHIFVTDEEDAEITSAAMSDPDARPLTDEEWERVKPLGRIGARPVGRPKVENPRRKVTLRLEAMVIDYFRSTGKGWQTRANNVLREAVEQGRI